MKPAIRVENLSKLFRLGTRQFGGYRTLREVVVEAVKAPWSRRQSKAGNASGRNEGGEPAETMWALKDVSFDIQPGEVVGLIGRNGAGKSTLLKVLSSITELTDGRVELRGRIGSLLEVGTGFHPELTGRENIYLNGAILGMSRHEIGRKFDEIVAFAEIDRFLDTPVKRYSSGMYVRLAFAVAAHLECEILLVDEVLAVGDVGFQQKCLGKIHNISRAGRTVVFVSHNMATVRSLCTRAIALEKGRLVGLGTVEECIGHYHQAADRSLSTFVELERPDQTDSAWMRWARLVSHTHDPGRLEIGDQIAIEVEFEAEGPVQRPQLGLVIRTVGGDNLLNANTHYQPAVYPSTPLCRGRIRCELGAVPLMPGSYTVSLWFGTQHVNTHVAHNVLRFDVHEKDIWGNGKVPPRNASFLWWPTQFVITASEEHANGR